MSLDGTRRSRLMTAGVDPVVSAVVASVVAVLGAAASVAVPAAVAVPPSSI